MSAARLRFILAFGGAPAALNLPLVLANLDWSQTAGILILVALYVMAHQPAGILAWYTAHGATGKPT